jgi:hypothetical protein
MSSQDVQVAAALFTALVVMLGVAASWGAMRANARNLERRDAANDKAHDEMWGTLRDHEGRIGWCEARVDRKADGHGV